MRQGYLSSATACTVRVRIAGSLAWLTVKGPTKANARAEFEYPIPVADADVMMASLVVGPLVEKVRYRVEHAAHVWEIDEFGGDNTGLVVAEIELARADADFARPDWLGAEVSADPRYFNSSLVAYPFSRWSRGDN